MTGRRRDTGQLSTVSHDDTQRLLADLSAEDLHVAVRLLGSLRRLQLTEMEALTRRLVHVVVAAGEDVLPPQLVRAAERRAAVRTWLLSTGYFTHETLAQLRGGTANAARVFVTRERDANRVFTIKHEGRTLIPAMLFDEDGGVTPVSHAVEVLRPSGVDGWALWAWLATPSGWLSGDVPAAVLVTDPERGSAAVRAYASSLDHAVAPAAG